MSVGTPTSDRLSDSLLLRVLSAAWTLVFRGTALIVFLLMSLAEPFLAVILGGAALACFFVSVFFGFILHVPFHSRWIILGASVVFLGFYILFRFLLLGVTRLLR